MLLRSEDRMRFGIAKLETAFPFVSALTFRYLCRIMGKKFSLYRNPGSLDEDTLLDYKEAVSRYPYCQYARLMFLLNLEQVEDESSFKSALSYVAIALPDRIRLKEQVDALASPPAVKNASAQPLSVKSGPMPNLFGHGRSGENRANASLPVGEPLPRASVPNPGSRSSALPTGVTQRIKDVGFVPLVETRNSSGRKVEVEQVWAMLHKGKEAEEERMSIPGNMTLSGMLGLGRTGLGQTGKSFSPAESVPESVDPASLSENLAGERRHVQSGPQPGQGDGKEVPVSLERAGKTPVPPQGKPSMPRISADELIARFLRNGGEHPIRIDDDFDYASFDPDQGGGSVEDFSFGTETLAEMYLKSNTPEKAIAVYEHLRLKNPEKSSYFAELIRKVKKDYSIK